MNTLIPTREITPLRAARPAPGVHARRPAALPCPRPGPRPRGRPARDKAATRAHSHVLSLTLSIHTLHDSCVVYFLRFYTHLLCVCVLLPHVRRTRVGQGHTGLDTHPYLQLSHRPSPLTAEAHGQTHRHTLRCI